MACQPQQQALTRPRFDEFHQADDMRISTYKARYYLNVPNHNCPTTFVVDPTIRLQKTGQSWVADNWRTDVESELRGINSFGNRVRDDKGLYDPRTNKYTNAPYQSAQDESFPTVFNHLVNPPCTLRATGWNRWVPLPHQPQETFETPFDFFIPARQLDKERCKTHKNNDKS